MLRRLSFLAGLFIFHLLFWREAFGLNLILFSAAAILLLRKFNPVERREWLYLAPFIASTIGVVFIHSSFSLVGLFLTAITYFGYIANREYSVVENFSNSAISFFTLRDWEISIPERYGLIKRPIPFGRKLSIAIIPSVIFILFYSFFVKANPVFEDLHHRTFAQFASFFESVDRVWLMFMILGTFIVRWAMLSTRPAYLQFNPQDNLLRRSKRRIGRMSNLKKEYYTAILVFGSLNVLFFIVNIIDINYVWFQVSLSEEFSLKSFVYNGVGWLIAITLISAGMLLYFFRGSLNFYPNNAWLKRLAIIWTVQNIVLSLSVSIRALHYIQFHGLAPLRIGVLLFTLIITIALIAVILKITNIRTTAWVTRLTSSFAIITLGVCTLIPWNTWMANHNLNHEMSNEIDLDYYLHLGPQTYPILYANLDKIESQYEAHSANDVNWLHHDYGSFKKSLDRRTISFLWDYELHNTWQSWTYADQRAYQKLKLINLDTRPVDETVVEPALQSH